jgi:hypothetical protein
MFKIKCARFIEVDAGVRYWEDGYINGVADTGGKIPFRKGDGWMPTIDLRSGHVLNWPAGIEARVYYKVCDAGLYWLLDENKQRIAKLKSHYVPDELQVTDGRKCGDYIIMTIFGDGSIDQWKAHELDATKWTPIEETQSS